ncbi:uncharacterized protein K489DRAFT_422756 [Dissoconium aciculare CBS 342.82]|uniref:Uncharacterized protein n=1 Tax=Dissoconium aciculare CBS 342.82 TaxID=1314786 RepID=A0A6J3M8D4_9PEZI|nr:uncharacterized protein K489DRAFT_422756 [Dissoconium aciculare CBS 342.82]KAF1824255.1 hypothetical protein K489DRAFT_422756 [Dissoconium aciculare CBS 342.82]
MTARQGGSEGWLHRRSCDKVHTLIVEGDAKSSPLTHPDSTEPTDGAFSANAMCTVRPNIAVAKVGAPKLHMGMRHAAFGSIDHMSRWLCPGGGCWEHLFVVGKDNEHARGTVKVDFMRLLNFAHLCRSCVFRIHSKPATNNNASFDPKVQAVIESACLSADGNVADELALPRPRIAGLDTDLPVHRDNLDNIR